MSLQISPRTSDIGFPVRRLLPSRLQQRVGPFIFVDHMGPALFAPGGTAGDVRQHPHIGLATVTYLFSGAMMHRDSLGTVQRIEPGAINLMTAGRGIVHSERMPADIREQGIAVHGMQTWLALPTAQQDMAPDFAHYPASAIPETQIPGGTLRVLIGSALGLQSPVRAHSPTTFLDLQLQAGAQIALHCPGQELAVYLAEGEATVNAQSVPGFHLQIEGDALQVQAGPAGCRAIVLGGEPLPGQRHVHWNFVSSSLEKVKQAGQDWQAQRFTLVPRETDWMPLPGL
jgi:redox-sensitive bicupin YhaK (pirin superfamily)